MLDSVPELASGQWRLLAWEVTGAEKHRGKHFVRCRVTWAVPAARREETVELFIKLYGSDRGGPSFASQQLLWDAGFRAPAPHRVPRAYGYSAAHGALVQGLVEGRLLADHLPDDPGLPAALDDATAWLIHLHRSEVAAPRPAADADLRLAERFLTELAGAFPAHRRRLERTFDALAALLDPDGRRLVPTHGDFHAKNLFLRPGSVMVIDHDTFGLREPEHDLGYALAQLLILSRFRHGTFAPGALAGLALWRRYREELPARWDRIAVHIARTLLQSLHYELCVLRNGKEELLAQWPALIAEVLHSEEGRPLARLAGDR